MAAQASCELSRLGPVRGVQRKSPTIRSHHQTGSSMLRFLLVEAAQVMGRSVSERDVTSTIPFVRPPPPGSHLLLARRLLGFRFPALMSRAFCPNWMLWALTIAMISPGKRFSSSAQRDVLCISTPIRSLRINPASRSALKCSERVDLGIVFWLTLRKLEQLSEHAEPTMSA